MENSIREKYYDIKQEEYRRTEDYKIAREMVYQFCIDYLDGDILKLKEFNFKDGLKGKKSKKYVGEINEPDMYLIMQSIYILVWGYLYDLRYSNMGSWGWRKENQFPYRGDTMNSCNSVFGKNNIIFDRYLEKDSEKELLSELVAEFRQKYDLLGNFIVIPNRKNTNSKRANPNLMQDYFDWFIAAYYGYKNVDISQYELFLNSVKVCFDANEDYQKMDFMMWIEKFFLHQYIENGKPKNVYEIDEKIRMKAYCGRKQRKRNGECTLGEYKELVENYCVKSKEIIISRSQNICDCINKEMNI